MGTGVTAMICRRVVESKRMCERVDCVVVVVAFARLWMGSSLHG